jgi:hypothetical protein
MPAMTSRQRLLATLRGEPVDRPAVSFYELDGSQDPADPDPFNIYRDPSWRELLAMTAERTDLIRRTGVAIADAPPDPTAGLQAGEERIDGEGRRHLHWRIRAGDRVLTRHQRRDPDIDTVWTIEHLIKDEADLAAWAGLPVAEPGGRAVVEPVLAIERRLGERGIVMIDTPDPLCAVAGEMEMGQFTVLALTETALVERAIERAAREILPRVRTIAEALPGRLWRIYGPEYAAPPYLPPRLYERLVGRWDRELVRIIQASGGWARIHSHGRLRGVLGQIAGLGADALDPLEPPPQGDMHLAEVKAAIGGQCVLFGNLEITDIENLPTADFRPRVRRAIAEGTAGAGRGFVLLPSAAPYGHQLGRQAIDNYAAILDEVGA